MAEIEVMNGAMEVDEEEGKGKVENVLIKKSVGINIDFQLFKSLN